MMKTGKVLEFKRFRDETRLKMNLPKNEKPFKPTSFREISESREKEKLASGKKSFSNIFKSPSSKNMNSGKKEGSNLFSQLLTSRSPSSIKKTKPFDLQNNKTNDSSTISFSAFKTISLPPENVESQKGMEMQESKSCKSNIEASKGLQFRNFPHRRNNIKDNAFKYQDKLVRKKSSVSHKDGNEESQKQNMSKMDTNNGFKLSKMILEQRKCEEVAKYDSPMKESVMRSRCDESLKFDMSPVIC